MKVDRRGLESGKRKQTALPCRHLDWGPFWTCDPQDSTPVTSAVLSPSAWAQQPRDAHGRKHGLESGVGCCAGPPGGQRSWALPPGRRRPRPPGPSAMPSVAGTISVCGRAHDGHHPPPQSPLLPDGPVSLHPTGLLLHPGLWRRPLVSGAGALTEASGPAGGLARGCPLMPAVEDSPQSASPVFLCWHYLIALFLPDQRPRRTPSLRGRILEQGRHRSS